MQNKRLKSKFGIFKKMEEMKTGVTGIAIIIVTDVLATTRTQVGITESPVSLDYWITATGSGGA